MTIDRDTIVLVEDDDSQRRVMQHSLEHAGYTLFVADNIQKGLDLIRAHNPRLVITDICLGNSSGLDLLNEIKSFRRQIMVLVITAFGSLQQAVDAIRLGAFDYLYKPFSSEQLLLAVYKALAFEELKEENKRLKTNKSYKGHRILLGDSQTIEIVHNLVRRMAGSNAPVMILGESGTGKELAARLLHNQSERSGNPFIAVNCAAIPANLLESELFGHIRGSFTGAVRDHKGKFEQAHGGTLFLDEVGELPLELQPKLLRVLQEQEVTPIGGQAKAVDVRIIAATNCKLEEMVHQGNFRSDLYYRLAVLPLQMPALRERSEDIGLLAQHFLDQNSMGRRVKLSKAAIGVLQNYSWPGNVRELENLMERLAILAHKEMIDKEDLPVHMQTCIDANEPCVVHLPMAGFSLRDVECQAIRQALAVTGGNLTQAAEFLKVPRHILAYRIDKYGINNDPAADHQN